MNFAWQKGYGVLSFSERHMRSVCAYVNNQKRHHRENNLNAILETVADEDTVLPDFVRDDSYVYYSMPEL